MAVSTVTERTIADKLPVALASWLVFTKDEQDKDAIARFKAILGSPPEHLVQHANHLWAGPIMEKES